MPIQFYDASVLSFLQITKAMTRFLDKGRVHLEGQGKDLAEVVDTRLYEDMLPFRFQIASVVAHSAGALRAAEEGEFLPPSSGERDYAGLQQWLTTTVAELKEWTPERAEALIGKELNFKFGELDLPFVAEDFLLSFSLPNFYFHATTAYDILRTLGVPVGKADFMGPIRFKR